APRLYRPAPAGRPPGREVPGGPLLEARLSPGRPRHGPGRDSLRPPVTPGRTRDRDRPLLGTRARLLRGPPRRRRPRPHRPLAADRRGLVGQLPLRDPRPLPLPARPDLSRPRSLVHPGGSGGGPSARRAASGLRICRRPSAFGVLSATGVAEAPQRL